MNLFMHSYGKFSNRIKRCACIMTGLLLGLALSVNAACTEEELEAMLLPGAGEVPFIIATNPADHQSGVNPESPVSVYFNMEMDHQKTQEAFRLSSGAGQVHGNFSWQAYQMLFQPRGNLDGNGEFILSVGSQAETSHGVDLGDDFNIHFLAGSDNLRPEFVSSTPGNADTNVSASTAIDLIFSEAIDFATVNDGISISPSFLYTTTQSSDKTQISFVPSSALSPGTYTITINRALKDLSGNELQNEITITFIVGTDFIGPAISSVFAGAIPLINGLRTSGVERTDALVITFSEPMEIAATEAAVSISPFVAGTKIWNLANDILTITFPNGLEPEKDYTLYIDATARDAVGNALSASAEYPFYTNAATSTRPFVITAEQLDSTGSAVHLTLTDFAAIDTAELIDLDPGAGTDYVLGVRLTFNNNMQRNTITPNVSVRRMADPVISTNIQVHSIVVSGNIVIVYLLGNPFAAHAVDIIPIWRLEVDHTVEDTSGNPMLNDFTLDFTY